MPAKFVFGQLKDKACGCLQMSDTKSVQSHGAKLHCQRRDSDNIADTERRIMDEEKEVCFGM